MRDWDRVRLYLKLNSKTGEGREGVEVGDDRGSEVLVRS